MIDQDSMKATGEPCPDCGGDLYVYDWWEGDPDHAGVIIGVWVECDSCDYYGTAAEYP